MHDFRLYAHFSCPSLLKSFHRAISTLLTVCVFYRLEKVSSFLNPPLVQGKKNTLTASDRLKVVCMHASNHR